MRVLILGGDGMLGHKAFQVLSKRFETYATFRHRDGIWATYPMYAKTSRARLIGGVDVLNSETLVRAFSRAEPDAVINCIGIIKQREEAKDPLISIAVNSLFPHRLADLCALTEARLFHMSTDCVFSGRQGDYSEADVPDAEDLYGRTKLLGEMDRAGTVTIRTSIIGRDFVKDAGLLEWFLSQRDKRVKGFTRAIYTGFPTQVLARIIGDLIEGYPELAGLYHIASEPISKYELLVRIRDAMNLSIEVDPAEDFVCDRSLDPTRFVEATGYQIPDWNAMVQELAGDPTPYDAWKRHHDIGAQG